MIKIPVVCWYVNTLVFYLLPQYYPLFMSSYAVFMYVVPLRISITWPVHVLFINLMFFDRVYVATIQILLVLVSFVLTQYLLPIPTMPILSGKYKVGCKNSTYQGLDMRVFYPTATTLNGTKPLKATLNGTKPLRYTYFGKRYNKGLATFTNLPSILFDAANETYLECTENAKPLKATFPVVVYSHGLGGTMEMYAAFVVDLASQGYIVVAVNHNDGSASVCQLPKGEMMYYVHRSAEEIKENEYEIRHGQLKQRVANVQLAFSYLQSEDMFLKHQMRLDELYTYGHSFGGATAIYTAYLDERVKGCVLLDAWMTPLPASVFQDGVQVPVLHLISTHFRDWKSNFNPVLALSRSCQEMQLFELKHSRHSNFSDIILFFPSYVNRKALLSGTIDEGKGIEIINSLSSSFLKSIANSTDFEVCVQSWQTFLNSIST